eukprot:GHVU01054769.1.p1 GENE.GHVU01054769.1~~GHVU01054769.1.p1  ORF type:complete len:241 (+),score=48.45 GHVU01054769.1:55-777(+)
MNSLSSNDVESGTCPDPAPAEVVLKVEKYIVGQIVGPKGSTIKDIQGRTGATVKIDGTMVMVTGAAEAVQAAADEINKIVEAARNPEYTSKQGKDLRVEAQKWASERSRLFEEAGKFFDSDKAKAAALRDEAKQAGLKMEEANKNAAKEIFCQNNPDIQGTGKVDLHGLFVEEAVAFTRVEVAAAKERNENQIEVMAGAGHHSKTSALIQPRIREVLQEMNASFSEPSPGAFMVSLIANE